MSNSEKKNTIRKPHRSSSTAKIFIFVVFAALICVVAVAAMSALNYKPTLPTDGDEDFPFQTLPENPSNGLEVSKPEINKDESESYTRTNKDKYNFLVLGCDRVGLNTDVIMLISFDTKTDEIAIMQIPRDTYVEVNGTSHKINSVYAAFYTQAKRNGENNPQNVGMSDFVNLLQTNMNIKIDYWALCNLDGFVNIIDIIGGVEIDVPFNMDYEDPYQNLYIHLKAGNQVLDGNHAEQFMRFRSNYIEGDVGRVNAQKIFLAALMRQIKTSVNITNLTAIVSEVMKNVDTTLGVSDIIYFAKEGLGADLSKLILLSLPGTEARANVDSGAWYYVMHRADTLLLINRYFNVYDNSVTDSIFDINRVFTNSSRSHINNIYLTKPVDALDSIITDGEKVNSESIDIPLLHN